MKLTIFAKGRARVERIKELIWIFAFSLAGELAHHFLPLPVPASIYGLLGLLAALKLGWLKPAKIERTADFLIEIMPLMFVPAGVGLLASWDTLRPVLVPVVCITLMSTVAVFGVTGVVAQRLLKSREADRDE